MRIGFDAAPIFSSYGGIGQYVRSLFPPMFKQNPEVEWVAYTPGGHSSTPFPMFQPSNLELKARRGNWPYGLRFRRAPLLDVFHGTNFTAKHVGQKGTVLTIHDLWLVRNPQYSKKFFGQLPSSWKLARQARRMSHIIAVSQFTAQEIHEVFHVPLDRIAVIYHGCSPEMFPENDPRKLEEVRSRLHMSHRPYILFVGGAEPRKNHRVLFQAFAQSQMLSQSFSLVAIGNVQARGYSLKHTAQEMGITDLVCCPGLVSTHDLRVLFSCAQAFVFPSWYEGFGMPVLEAMACGAPVVTGEETALPEVGADSALYVNPRDPEQLATTLEELVGDSELHGRLREKGFKRAQEFTWDQAARETFDLYGTLSK